MNEKKELVSEAELTFDYEPRMRALTPAEAKTATLAGLYPRVIIASMSAVLRKDLNELLKCYGSCLWTATALMCFRILERELREHLREYYDVTDRLDSLRDCIEHFRNHTNNERFLKNLGRIRVARNASIHGNGRFAVEETRTLFRQTLIIAAWTNNYQR